MNILYIEEIVQSVRPCVISIVGLTKVGSCCIVIHNIWCKGMRQCINEWCSIVDSEIWAKQQPLDRGNVNIHISEYMPIVKMIILIMIQFAHRILSVAHTTNRTTKCNTVLFINRYYWAHLQSILHRSTINLFVVAYSEVLTYFDDVIESVRVIHTGLNTWEVCVLQDTIIFLIAQREHRC